MMADEATSDNEVCINNEDSSSTAQAQLHSRDDSVLDSKSSSASPPSLPAYRDYSGSIDEIQFSETQSYSDKVEELKLKKASVAAGVAARAACRSHSNDPIPVPIDAIGGIASKKFSYPMVLHSVLEHAEEQGYNNIVSWKFHGRAFCVHNPERFVIDVMPQFFRQTRYPSFLRQLALYGFRRISSKGTLDEGSYYHEMFLRGKPHLCREIKRIPKKGGHSRKLSADPDFASMPLVAVVQSAEADQEIVEAPQESLSCNVSHTVPNERIQLFPTVFPSNYVAALPFPEINLQYAQIGLHETSTSSGSISHLQLDESRLDTFTLRNGTDNEECFPYEQETKISEGKNQGHQDLHSNSIDLLDHTSAKDQEYLFLQWMQNQVVEHGLQYQNQVPSSSVASAQLPSSGHTDTTHGRQATSGSDTGAATFEATLTANPIMNERSFQTGNEFSQFAEFGGGVDSDENMELGGMVHFLSDVDFDRNSPENP